LERSTTIQGDRLHAALSHAYDVFSAPRNHLHYLPNQSWKAEKVAVQAAIYANV